MQDSNSFDRDSEPANRFGETDHCVIYADAKVVSQPRTVSEAADTLHTASTDPNNKAFMWLDMLRPTPQELAEVGSRFSLHPRAVEDAVAAHQRPEYQHYGATDFMVLRPARRDQHERSVSVSQTPAVMEISLGELHVLIGAAFVIWIAHTDTINLTAVRQTMERDPWFLKYPQLTALYRIVEVVVNGYEPLLSGLEDYTDELEERIFGSGPVPSQDIYAVSRELIELERAVNPLRGLLGTLQASQQHHHPPIELLRNLGNVSNHIYETTERMERLRRVVREIFSVNTTLVAEQQNEDMRKMNELSMQQNEQMKKITAWAGVFFFPSLISGVYGMNFRHMPELHWLLGYPLSIGLMLTGCLVLFLIFKRVGWL